MTSPMWVPIASAVVSGAAGITGALGGAKLVQQATQEREERQYQRQRSDKRREFLQQLYLDMAQHVEETARWIDRETDDVTAWIDPKPDYPVSTARLTPRVELYCDSDMFQSWNDYTWQVEVFSEEDRMSGRGRQWTEEDLAVAKLRRKIEAVKTSLKSAVAGDDDWSGAHTGHKTP